MKLNRAYKTESGILKFFVSEEKAYGFNADKSWMGYSPDQKYKLTDKGWNKWKKAEKKEWEEALIEEAKKRSYEEGNYLCMDIPEATVKAPYNFFLEKEILWKGTENNANAIFKEGIWATKINNKDILEKTDYLISLFAALLPCEGATTDYTPVECALVSIKCTIDALKNNAWQNIEVIKEYEEIKEELEKL